jgi:hypothetical protein
MNHRGNVCTLLTALIVLGACSGSAGSKTDLPNDFTIELLGKCFLYSFSYQRTIHDHLGIELGVSFLGGSGGGALFFSGGTKAYFSEKDASAFIAGGIVVLTSTSRPSFFDESTHYFFFQPGFESRSSGGFIFRGGVYFLVREGFVVWPGVQLGVAF